MLLDRLPPRPVLAFTAAALLGLAAALVAWIGFFASAAWWLLAAWWVLPAGFLWWRWARPQGKLLRAATASLLYVFWWPVALLVADALGLATLRATLALYGTVALFFVGLLWTVYGVERASQHYAALRRRGEIATDAPDAAYPLPAWPTLLFTGALAALCIGSVVDVAGTHYLERGLAALGVSAQPGEPEGYGEPAPPSPARFYATWLLVTLLLGSAGALAAVWGRWAWRHPGVRNPLDLAAWYYGRQSQKLRQSLATLASYSVAFFLLLLVCGQLGGCDIYEMPAGGGGGGKVESLPLAVRIQKIVKKKLVINPFSAIDFHPPPIDEVKLELKEITEHLYTIGQGQGIGHGSGQGSGFAGGTFKGKVRFIRLEYAGDGWAEDMGIGGDQNLILWYAARTGQKVSEQTESRTVSQLAGFPLGKSPPVVYLTGKGSVSLSRSEIKTLREYLIDKHGMLFADNGGGWHFHSQFFGMMRQVLPTVEPVKIPLDDVIHRVPFPLPRVPYVAPHGGTEALGWKVDGRWVCYYHPGDIGDAWTDDHSGVNADVYEACYALGTNVIFYAHVEYSKWLMAREEE
jgi:hypothetical protein